MDKSWMTKPRTHPEYRRGVESFLEFAFRNANHGGKILCPCFNCANRVLQPYTESRIHLICDGFMRSGYTDWIAHGEVSTTPNEEPNNPNITVEREVRTTIRPLVNQCRHDINGLLRDVLGHAREEDLSDGLEDGSNSQVPAQENENDDVIREGHGSEEPTEMGDTTSKFFKLLEDANKELYPGCTNFSKLSFLLHLFHIKCMNGMTKETFEMILRLFIDVHPGISLPESYYEAKKIITALGLGYIKIDACPNDCVLFRGERINDEVCNVCGDSRWKISKNDEVVEAYTSKRKKQTPAKVLRYFPLIPRLQRLFMSSKTSDDMRWHVEGRKNDGLLRHPADGTAWKSFDLRYPEFSTDARNVRLALSSDGFNPFRTMSVTHSTWPVVLVPYNLPPWIGMKQSSFIISMIIPVQKVPEMI